MCTVHCAGTAAQLHVGGATATFLVHVQEFVDFLEQNLGLSDKEDETSSRAETTAQPRERARKDPASRPATPDYSSSKATSG